MLEYRVKVHGNGNKFWYVNGELHREDGPAAEYANGNKFWYVNGKLHREDGPAAEYAGGDKRWCLNGKHLTKATFNKRMAKKNEPCAGRVIEIDGVKYKLTAV